jgi:hypothetical protein
MSSAVAALIEGHTPAARHGRRSAYRAMCACCTPEPEGTEGKPQRRTVPKPTLAWRTRLAAQQVLAGDLDESTI